MGIKIKRDLFHDLKALKAEWWCKPGSVIYIASDQTHVSYKNFWVEVGALENPGKEFVVTTMIMLEILLAGETKVNLYEIFGCTSVL